MIISVLPMAYSMSLFPYESRVILTLAQRAEHYPLEY